MDVGNFFCIAFVDGSYNPIHIVLNICVNTDTTTRWTTIADNADEKSPRFIIPLAVTIDLQR